MELWTVVGGQFSGDNEKTPVQPNTFTVTLERDDGEKRQVSLSSDEIGHIKPGKTYHLMPDGQLFRVIRVVAAVICRGHSVFATQRGYGEWKDLWEFPGGKIEKGETPENALVREISEELATTVRVDRYLTTLEYDYPDFHLSMDCFLCSVLEGQLTLLEHEDARWISADALEQVEWLPADHLLLDTIRAVLTEPDQQTTEQVSPDAGIRS